MSEWVWNWMKGARAKGSAGSAPCAPPEEEEEGWCSALLPLSLLQRQLVHGKLQVGLGKPCLCPKPSEKYNSGDSPAAWPAQALLRAGTPCLGLSGTWQGSGALGDTELATTAHVGPWQGRWEWGVGPYSPALPSAPAFLRNMDTSLQEAGRRVIWSRGCLLSFPGSGQDTLFTSSFLLCF